MKNTKLTLVEWEQIIINRAFGMGTVANAKAVGLTRQAVGNVLDAFDSVKEQDWAKACNMIVTRYMTLEVFKWSAEKCGIELPEVVVKAYDDYIEKRRAENAQKKAAAASKAPEPAPSPAPQEENNRLFFIKMLEHMAKMNELLEQFMDVVIPKYVGDLKDNANANADVICERLKSCEDKLEAIKANTRKRGL